MKIIITGETTFDNYPLLARKLDILTKSIRKLTIITQGRSGKSKKGLAPIGVEALAMAWAFARMERKITCEIFHPSKNTMKEKHPEPLLEQNRWEMLAGAAGIIAITNGTDAETKALLAGAKRRKIKIKIVEV